MRDDRTHHDPRRTIAFYARVSRRGFMGATAGATLSALVGREPSLVRRQAPRQTPPTADAVIVLWMAGGMAQTETFDPKRYTPFEPGVRSRSRCSARSRRSTRRSTTSSSRRAWSTSRSVMDRGTLIRTYNAADLGFILHSRHQYHWHTGYVPPQPWPCRTSGAVIAKTLGPEEPGRAGVHRHRPAVEGAGEIGEAQGVPHRRLPRHRVRAVPDRRSAGRGVGGAAAEGAGRRAVPQPARAAREAAGAGAGRTSTAATTSTSRCCGRSTRADRLLTLAVGQGVRPVARAEEELRRLQHRPLRAGLPAGAAAGRGRRALHRGDHGVHPVPALGHARERPRRADGDEEADRRADRAARSSTWKSAACSTARWSCSPASSAAT